ncbi:carbohydrate-binding domain-containing protein [Schinkia azotoformans]|uniref:Dockerin type 1 n=1 Tax=Schinkia azotoformans LMG 9581 TaxID=1131731 RepID=K6DIH1_SCHAZ|nr:carbohydrate-binding domain-containing protein [Schinkia azotoformans]EKN67923.1 hypothetical protein BAZO_06909 [Schinkia azotoformans LMG 9581]MEC1637057.1 carbohydrate-binding domain-containing protein [Schinkia azotoformans]MEC1719917.1 carbohydrate-binding domain-containing protein [Schinkia azotoformans]MEC1945498.1 carbohydrate-binding domain-containing protein [Schinkia azotoformans]MED4351342.1 carbohydrate-binding domain-containing protein [Schinkia azotoformans]
MTKKTKYFKAAAILVSTSLLFACSNNLDSEAVEGAQTENGSSSVSVVNVSALISEKVKYDKGDFYNDWENENPILVKLNGTDVSYDSATPVIYDNNRLTIKTGGTYVISGELLDGQIVIDAEDKSPVRLVLNGAKINCSNSSAIYVAKAEKTVISLPEGTENYLSDGQQYVFDDSSEAEPNAALFSKDDLTINGTGKLIVQGNYNNGIASKDDLKITGGDLHIKAVDDGLMGRDLLAVKEGNIVIEAGGDGIKSTNDKDASKGIVALEGGTFDIASGNDGIQAETSLWIADGSYKIKSGGGSPEVINNSEEKARGPWGGSAVPVSTEDTDSESAKGLKAGTAIAVGGGSFTIDSLDDGVHSNDSIEIGNGDFMIATGDDGIHADSSIVTTGGKITITKSYEGIESQLITVNDGEIHVTASDDGINIGGGNDGSGFDVPPQIEGTRGPVGEANNENASKASSNNETKTASEENKLTINGGYITVNANGDGLDSNGSIAMTGGTVIVNGPTSNGNGPLDYDNSFDMSGGFLIAVGSSGMAQAVSEESSQYSLLMTYPETQKAGALVHLEDSKGESIVTFAPEKDYQSVFISSPKLEKGSSYTLFTGGASTGKDINGLYSDGDYQGGTKVVDFTISDSVTWLNETGITTASSHGPGGFNPGGGQNRPGGSGDNPGDIFKDLDEATMEKVRSIMDQERAGSITREEAQAQLTELGVESPKRGPRQ